MALITLYSTDLGIRRLLAQARDFTHPEAGVLVSGINDAPGHAPLFGDYLAALKVAYAMGTDWWESIIATQEKKSGTRDEAILDAFNDRAAGAAAHPYVVWTVRKFWLAGVALNQSMPVSDRVAPQIIILQWLIDAGETELVRLIACMPYWPIGLDENGNWC